MPYLSRDGVALAYDKVDGPGQPLVFVHGWCCDRSYFGAQVDHFTRLGHAVVSLDLRGHGESDAPEGDYAMQVFADDAAWLLGELGIERPVVVGHSMGGIVAFDLALRHPDAVAGIVMIDSAVVRPAASRAGMPAFLEKLRGTEGEGALLDYVDRVLFLPTDNPEIRSRVLAAMPKTARHAMIGAFQAMHDWDPGDAAGKTLPPSLFIAADGRPLSDMPRFFALVPGLLYGQTVGSGHFCQIEVPDQVNAMLARYLAILPALAAPQTS